MRWIWNRAFLAAYRFVPHRLVNRTFAWAARRRRPRRFVRWAIRSLGGDADAGHPTLEAWFLRSLPAGSRPLGEGFVSPVDGRLVSSGPIERGTILQLKGRPIAIDRMVGSPVVAYEGGGHVNLFLDPRGYHHVHMPTDGTVESVRWLPGRFFPQNELALRHLARVYERNERAVLACRSPEGAPFLVVMVGASIVGGIEIDGIDRADWVGPEPRSLGLVRAKGERIGHFAFGSTVVLLLGPDWPRPALREPGREVRLGETILELDSHRERRAGDACPTGRR